MRYPMFAALLFIAACSSPESGNEPAQADIRLEPLWVAEGFSAPEGVAAAPGGGYFISNVMGEGEIKDGEGWVSLISADGEILNTEFVDGLDAPKGMAVLDAVLYVADIDQVRLYDATTGEAKGAIAIEGAKFLNDATLWQGAVFVSDSQTSTIHKIENGTASVWLNSKLLSGVNGLLGDGDTLYISTMTSGALYAADADAALSEITKGMKNADGIGLVPGGGWLVSSWPGEIYYVSVEGKKTKLLDTTEQPILQNDLSVFGDVVIVPNWAPSTVTAWRIVR